MKPSVYDIVKKEELTEILKAFQAVMELPIQMIDSSGNIIEAYGPVANYCKILKRQILPLHSCEDIRIKAGQVAQDLGETYIFSCHAGLTNMAFPLVYKDILYGAILVGPFLMDAPDSTLILGLAKNYPLTTSCLLDLYDELTTIRIIAPDVVSHMSQLLYYLFSGLIPTDKQRLQLNHEKLVQQSRINESIQHYKTQGVETTATYPYDLEKKLLTKVRTGNIPDAKGVLNELLSYVLFSEGNDLEVMKSRTVELCSVLSRTAIEGGAVLDSIFRLNNQFIKSVRTLLTVDDLCYRLQEMVEAYMESMFPYSEHAGSDLIKKAIAYIGKNYSIHITLEDVAAQVGLSPSYFSTIFKQSTGSGFKDYLNLVRIEESKHLLLGTDYSIVDIAIAVGFEDQSYFSKVFKKYTGITPKQYR